LKTKLNPLIRMTFLCLIVAGCESESQERSAAQRALDELQVQYDELLKDKVEVPVDWAADDLENIGDWEYRVINLAFDSPVELESRLNELGDERWEVIWLEASPDGFLAVMKKPSVSWLSRIPLSELGRIVTGGSVGE